MAWWDNQLRLDDLKRAARYGYERYNMGGREYAEGLNPYKTYSWLLDRAYCQGIRCAMRKERLESINLDLTA